MFWDNTRRLYKPPATTLFALSDSDVGKSPSRFHAYLLDNSGISTPMDAEP
jgi:hypothetical protein